MNKDIKVNVLFDGNIPDKKSQYTASVNYENYKITVSGGSVAECFEQIAISMFVEDSYRDKEKVYLRKV